MLLKLILQGAKAKSIIQHSTYLQAVMARGIHISSMKQWTGEEMNGRILDTNCLCPQKVIFCETTLMPLHGHKMNSNSPKQYFRKNEKRKPEGKEMESYEVENTRSYMPWSMR